MSTVKFTGRCRVVKNRGGFVVMLVAKPITRSMFLDKHGEVHLPMYAQWFKTRYAATKKARDYTLANTVQL